MARRKGFSIKLTKSAWLYMGQVCAWMQKKGITTKEMDEIIEMFPEIQPSQQAMSNIHSSGHHFWQELQGYKSLRVRGEHVGPLLQVLKDVSFFAQYGSLGNVLLTRIRYLNDIQPMDILADAARG